MKGILHKAEQGWIVVYDEIIGENIVKKNQNSLLLHPDSQTWMDGYNLYQGKEVEFEVRVYPSGTRYAKTIHEDDLGCSYPDCICQGNEITDCQNRTPKQRQIMKKVQTPDQVVLGDKTALVENNQELEKLILFNYFLLKYISTLFNYLPGDIIINSTYRIIEEDSKDQLSKYKFEIKNKKFDNINLDLNDFNFIKI